MKTIQQVSKDFLAHCKWGKNLSDKTIKAYSIDLGQLTTFIKRSRCSRRIIEIDKEIIRKYVQSLSEFKSKTIRRKVASVKALFNYLEFEDQIKVNPFRKIKINITLGI